MHEEYYMPSYSIAYPVSDDRNLAARRRLALVEAIWSINEAVKAPKREREASALIIIAREEPQGQ